MTIEHWEIDSSRSGILFAVRHLVVSRTSGRFTRWNGSVIVPDGDLTRAVVDVVIDPSSIDTGVRRRDEHLRSAEYLDVKRYPTITFIGRHVSVEPNWRWRVSGGLTIRNITREVTLAVERHRCMRDSQGNDRARFAATTTIDRREFGLTGNLALDAGGLVIGDRIDIDIEVETVRRSAIRAA